MSPLSAYPTFHPFYLSEPSPFHLHTHFLSFFTPVAPTASCFFYPHIHHFQLHLVIHLMALHVLYNNHAYHYPSIPNFLIFFSPPFLSLHHIICPNPPNTPLSIPSSPAPCKGHFKPFSEPSIYIIFPSYPRPE